MVVGSENRKKVLLAAGVNEGFLSAIENPDDFDDLEYVAKFPEGFYFYLAPVYENYEILRGYDVTPIYEGGNGDTYYVLLSREKEIRFVHFGLEQDAIYKDYGDKFQNMLVDFLIYYYEFATELNVECLARLGKKMGFENSAGLFKALEYADENGLRKTSELDKKWRKDYLVQYIE